jgi:glyoxylase-like metal-dependent hydrolase (beta-lactamase superfamily II)
MTYTGRVQLGGAPHVRELGSLTLTKLAVGPLDNNVYLLQAEDGSNLLVDAAAEPAAILALLPDHRLDAVLTTHAHRDHWQGLAEVVEATGARTLASSLDAPQIAVPTDVTVQHADTYQLGGVTLDIIGLRGHTPGSVALHFTDDAGSDHLLTGDSLFPGGIGRTTEDTFEQLFTDVSERLFDSYADAWVYPGHGWDTTLGAERPQLAAWWERRW